MIVYQVTKPSWNRVNGIEIEEISTSENENANDFLMEISFAIKNNFFLMIWIFISDDVRGYVHTEMKNQL